MKFTGHSEDDDNGDGAPIRAFSAQFYDKPLRVRTTVTYMPPVGECQNVGRVVDRHAIHKIHKIRNTPNTQYRTYPKYANAPNTQIYMYTPGKIASTFAFIDFKEQEKENLEVKFAAGGRQISPTFTFIDLFCGDRIISTSTSLFQAVISVF